MSRFFFLGRPRDDRCGRRVLKEAATASEMGEAVAVAVACGSVLS